MVSVGHRNNNPRQATSSLPRRFLNLFALRVELQRHPERVGSTLEVLHVENISIPREEVYTSGENGFDCKQLYLHEAEGCAFTIPGLGPTGPYHPALSRIFQSRISMSHSQPAQALVGIHGSIRRVNVKYLHLQ